MSKTWIQSFSGLKIELLSPSLASIEIGDIAHALARLCRYTGHTAHHLSVAEHSVRVSWRAGQLAWDAGKAAKRPALEILDRVRLACRWGLLHDATEAYLGDVSSPLKRLPGMEGYRQLENVWMRAIAQRFGLPLPIPPEVEKADVEMLGTEAFHLMQPLHPEWGSTCPGGKLPDPDVGAVLGWRAEDAERVFHARFQELFGLATPTPAKVEAPAPSPPPLPRRS